METPIKMEDLGVHLFLETPWNTHIHSNILIVIKDIQSLSLKYLFPPKSVQFIQTKTNVSSGFSFISLIAASIAPASQASCIFFWRIELREPSGRASSAMEPADPMAKSPRIWTRKCQNEMSAAVLEVRNFLSNLVRIKLYEYTLMVRAKYLLQFVK